MDYLGCSLLLTGVILLRHLVSLVLLKPGDQLWLVLLHQAHLDRTFLTVALLQPFVIRPDKLQCTRLTFTESCVPPLSALVKSGYSVLGV